MNCVSYNYSLLLNMYFCNFYIYELNAHSEYIDIKGGSKKYPSRQYAISPQPAARFLKFLKLFNSDTSPSRTVYNAPTAR